MVANFGNLSLELPYWLIKATWLMAHVEGESSLGQLEEFVLEMPPGGQLSQIVTGASLVADSSNLVWMRPEIRGISIRPKILPNYSA